MISEKKERKKKEGKQERKNFKAEELEVQIKDEEESRHI
jgi:hypothetical protein